MNDFDVQQQFEAFVSDALVPTTKGVTPFDQIYKTYQKYCRAIDQDAPISKHSFAQRLRHFYFRKMRAGYSFYTCKIREDLFVQVEE